jgi:hypothetical protein
MKKNVHDRDYNGVYEQKKADNSLRLAQTLVIAPNIDMSIWAITWYNIRPVRATLFDDFSISAENDIAEQERPSRRQFNGLAV